MTRNEKMNLIERLCAKGEELSARVCANDWHISQKTVNKICEKLGVDYKK